MAFDRVVLVLAGGNALGAYHAGAWAALQERGIEPNQVIGASIGAVVGAIVAGNAPEARVEMLRRFCAASEQFWSRNPVGAWFDAVSPRSTRAAAALHTLLAGRPGLFHPTMPGATRLSLFDHAPLAKTLTEVVDFGRLNAGQVRFIATAVDVEDGTDAAFDTTALPLDPLHLRASSAFPGLFPPVEIAGRTYVDGGLGANLPLWPLIGQELPGRTLCIAVDLFGLHGPVPRSLGDAVKRGQSLAFARQSQHAIDAFGRQGMSLGPAESRRRKRSEESPPGEAQQLTLLHVVYGERAEESPAMVLDYSTGAMRSRWEAGERDMAAALAALGDTAGQGGYAAFRFEQGRLEQFAGKETAQRS